MHILTYSSFCCQLLKLRSIFVLLKIALTVHVTTFENEPQLQPAEASEDTCDQQWAKVD